jgi:pimeloyl-ACP methyl ester carboxylesterase
MKVGAVAGTATEFVAIDGETLELLFRPAVRPNGAPPLLFLHGAFTAAWVWDEHFFDWFSARGYDCYALSFRGHGASSGRDRLHHFGIDHFVADTRAAIAAIGANPVLVGHSMGGLVAQLCIGSERLAGLVLIASVPPSGMAPVTPWMAFSELGLWTELVWSMSFGSRRQSMRILDRAMFAHPPDPATAKSYAGRFQDEAPQAVLQAQMPHQVTSAWLASVPALVLSPALDKVVPADLGHITAMLHQASYVNIAEVGHVAMLDREWASVADAICAWLSGQGL